MAAALEAASRVKQIGGVDIAVWMTAMSPASGRVAWTAQVEHLSEVETAMDKLAADSGYMDWLTSIDSYFTGPTTDAALQVVSGAPSGERPGYAQVATGICANGALAAAMAAGVEVAADGDAAHRERGAVLQLGDRPVRRRRLDHGRRRIIDALEAGGEATAADPEWLALVDRVGPSFAPGVEVTLWRSIG